MSLWGKYQNDFHFAPLKKDIEVDVLIIGGGICGLSTLYYLKDHPSVCLVESQSIGSGVSKNTTGKLTYLQSKIYTDLEKNINYEIASSYLKSQLYAISLIKKIIANESLACDLEKVTSYLHADKKKDLKVLAQEKKFLEENGLVVHENESAIWVEDTYVFNPIKYLNGLKEILKEKEIYEHTQVVDVQYKNNQYVCSTFNGQKILANQVIFACHYPFFLFPFCLPLYSHIEKSYLIAYQTDVNKRTSGITISNPGYSYRYYKDGKKIYKICLASSHHAAIKQNDCQNFSKVKEKFSIPEDKIVSKWSNVDIITDDKLPFIGEIKNHCYLATGFNTWGMTNGLLAAKIISDAILGKKNQYAFLFQTKRFNFYRMKSFMINTFGSVYNYIVSHFHKDWYPNTLYFEKKKNTLVAIYVDESGRKHKVIPKCPHMKCGLVFNEVEKTWDCPCHSSRFDLDGNCMKGPSTKSITYKG